MILAPTVVLVAMYVHHRWLVEPLRSLCTTSRGYLHPTLLVNMLAAYASIFWVIRAGGHVPFAQIGWRREMLRAGILATLCLFAGTNLFLLAREWFSGHGVHGNPAWSEARRGAAAGYLLAQLFGNALVEESVFRGFLLPQLFRRWRERLAAPLALAAAVVVSQVAFALAHIPARLASGVAPADLSLPLLSIACWGVCFALIYLHTGNLFLVMGFHALLNAPSILIETSLPPQRVVLWLGVGIALLAAMGRHRRVGHSASPDRLGDAL